MSTISISDSLFSKTQQKVLALVFLNADRSFYLNEIVRHAQAGKGAVQREISKLETAGLVTVNQHGNQKHFKANPDSPIFVELRSLIVKTFGIREVLLGCLSGQASNIPLAFVFGSIAKGKEHSRSDIDLMVVSDQLALPELFDLLQPAEEQIGRAIQPTLYRIAEFEQRQGTEFMRRILDNSVIPLIGNIDEYARKQI
jgi:hypothetical protein